MGHPNQKWFPSNAFLTAPNRKFLDPTLRIGHYSGYGLQIVSDSHQKLAKLRYHSFSIEEDAHLPYFFIGNLQITESGKANGKQKF